MKITDIARIVGVSATTVSRVINGGIVRERTRQRVMAVMAKYNYRPDPHAQYLGRRPNGCFLPGPANKESLIVELELQGMPKHCGLCPRYPVCAKGDPARFCIWLRKYLSFTRHSSR